MLFNAGIKLIKVIEVAEYFWEWGNKGSRKEEVTGKWVEVEVGEKEGMGGGRG